MQFRNTFLTSMDPVDLAELSPFVREATLYSGQRLYEPGDPVDLVYFPSCCSIAIVTVMRDGHDVETASVGFEGVAGLSPAINHGASSSRMFVQIGGGAMALPAGSLRAMARQSPSLMMGILRSTQAAAARVEQSAACNAVHSLRARLARWLLTCEDRVGRPTMALTQDDMGMMVGAPRSSISLTASEFKHAGLIGYSRGHLEILDRPGLERLACECYRGGEAALPEARSDGAGALAFHA